MVSSSRTGLVSGLLLALLSVCRGQEFYRGGDGGMGGIFIEHSSGFTDAFPPGEMQFHSSDFSSPGEFIQDHGLAQSYPAEVLLDPGTPVYDRSTVPTSTARSVSREVTFPRKTRTSRTRQIIRSSRLPSSRGLESMMSEMMRNLMRSQGGRGNFHVSFEIRQGPTTRSQPRSRSRTSSRAFRDFFLRQPTRRIETFRDPADREGEWTPRVPHGGGPSPPRPVPSRPTGNRGAPGRFGLTQRHVQQILKEHNRARAELGAADMYRMHWDDQLAVEANDWIQQCEMTHKGYGGRGENLAMVGGYGMDIDAVVNYGLTGWYEEKYLWKYGDGFSTATGHYTQMIWSSSRYVGCAAKKCAGNTLYFFCFYSPQGNIMGRNPYEKGTPCSACRGVCSRGLCQ